MKRIVSIFLLAGFSYIGAEAQIIVNITGRNAKMLYLQAFTLSGYQPVDSVVVMDNVARFERTGNTPPGMYRIGDRSQGFSFILNEQNLVFSTTYPDMEENLEVQKSTENLVLQEYERTRDQAYMKLDLLNQVLSVYDPYSVFYHTTLMEFIGVQDQFEKWTDSVRQVYPQAYVSAYIRADKKPYIMPGFKPEAQKEFFREHWFDEVDWMDYRLMTSDVLTSKITSYLGLYSNPNQGKAELSQSFMQAVDQILPKARQNPAMLSFCIKYLIRGFEMYGFEDVILHIATNYSSTEQCENEQQSETIARLEKYKLMAVGNTAPDLSLQDLEGKMIRLSAIKEQKLLVFWASWCPHCRELLPQLVYWSAGKDKGKVRIIPVSLDESRPELMKAIGELHISWPVYCDFKKWNSPAAISYNIYATPSMILLGADNRILAKPVNMGELMRAVE